MKFLVALILATVASVAEAEPFATGNSAAGQNLFDQSGCNRCHVSMMGGDGSAIFTRSGHKVRTPQQLVDQLRVCAGGAGITLTHQREQDLGAYLNQRYYHFK